MSDQGRSAVNQVAVRHLQKIAGEVRFIKDRGGDHNEWGWNPPGASERTIDPEYKFDARNLEPLARTLRSCLMALGHIQTARTTFTRIKSQRISPDGNLGGKGYVMPVKDIRKQLSNCDEALSSITDTLYDEMHAPHWLPQEKVGPDPRQRPELRNIMDDVEEIRDDPEDWAEGEEAEEDQDGGAPRGKTATTKMFLTAPGNLQRRRRLQDEVSHAECPEEAQAQARAQFHQQVLHIGEQLAQGMRKLDWRGSYHPRPAFDRDANIGFAVDKIDVSEWPLPDDEIYFSCEGHYRTMETDVSVQYDVDDVDDATVDVDCPPNKVEYFTILEQHNTWKKDSPKFPPTPAGIQRALTWLIGQTQHHQMVGRVASRYLLARGNG